jgi:hypothetical protein
MSNAGIAKQKKELKGNSVLMTRTAEVNRYDVKLYKYGKSLTN